MVSLCLLAVTAGRRDLWPCCRRKRALAGVWQCRGGLGDSCAAGCYGEDRAPGVGLGRARRRRAAWVRRPFRFHGRQRKRPPVRGRRKEMREEEKKSEGVK